MANDDTRRKLVLAACIKSGMTLGLPENKEYRNDKAIVLAACTQNGRALKWASPELQNDEEVVLVACSGNGLAFESASQELKNDKELVLKVCSTSKGFFIRSVSSELQTDKDIVLATCSGNGWNLPYVSERFRADKDVVLAAVQTHPQSLKHALGGLNQDKDCLIKAGLWDEDHVDRNSTSALKRKKIVLSTRFSLAANSSPFATTFTLALKKHPYIANGFFLVYSPNAFSKGTCDPNWTNINWPCRGTYETCCKPSQYKKGVPNEEECCWRYSFRYHLREASSSGGFMIQVVEFKRLNDKDTSRRSKYKIGDGQMIEIDMAKDEGVKIFRFYELGHLGSLDTFITDIENWYSDGCGDMRQYNSSDLGIGDYYSCVGRATPKNAAKGTNQRIRIENTDFKGSLLDAIKRRKMEERLAERKGVRVDWMPSLLHDPLFVPLLIVFG